MTAQTEVTTTMEERDPRQNPDTGDILRRGPDARPTFFHVHAVLNSIVRGEMVVYRGTKVHNRNRFTYTLDWWRRVVAPGATVERGSP